MLSTNPFSILAETVSPIFMQWFVIEQREEENKFKSIIDDIKIIGDSGSGLYELNKQLGSLTEEE